LIVLPTGLGKTVIALILIVFGVSSLIQGTLNYPNYWGAPVFGPIAILIGILLLIIVIFKEDVL